MARSLVLQVRMDAEERERLEDRATAAGYKGIGTWLRDLGLGLIETSQASPVPRPDGAGAGTDVGEECAGPGEPPSGSIPAPAEPSGSDFSPGLEERIAAEDVAAEVQEARLADEPAREAFLERRTRQLVGAGNTTRRARQLAAQEWAER